MHHNIDDKDSTSHDGDDPTTMLSSRSGLATGTRPLGVTGCEDTSANTQCRWQQANRTSDAQTQTQSYLYLL